MRKLWKGVLIGGAVGAGVRLAQDSRRQGDAADTGVEVARAAAQAALVGGVIGWALDRRDARRLAALTTSPSLAAVLAQAGDRAEDVRLAAEVARRKAHAAAELALPVLHDAADSARERIALATETARPHVAAVAEVARERAHQAGAAARPHVTSAMELAAARATLAGEAARPKLDQARASFHDLADAGRQRVGA